MNLEYTVKFSKRKTLNITVERNREVVVRAPESLSLAKIDELVQSKKQWITAKINESPKYPIQHEQKEFASGESLLYLGRNYQLLVVDTLLEGIEFNERFTISQTNQHKANVLFKEWYIAKAKEKIEPIAQQYATNLGISYNECKISEMKYRWGSCTPNNNIIFNWRIIKAPIYVIHYLVVHELAHLIIDDHSPYFWNIVSIQVPYYQKAKKWLQEHGNSLEIDF